MSPTAQRIVDRVAPAVAYAYIRLLRLTMRLEYRNREALTRARELAGQYIVTFWHSRFVMMPYCYPDQRLVILQSSHRDGQLLAQVMWRFGLMTAWGSSSEGGTTGVREILRRVREGCDVGITPDGPRGPRRRVQPGVITISRLSGKPIIPVAFAARPSRRIRSWDRTLVPYPFGRGLFLYGDPIAVARRADEEGQELRRLELEAELDRLTDLADREIGIPEEDRRPAPDGVAGQAER